MHTIFRLNSQLNKKRYSDYYSKLIYNQMHTYYVMLIHTYPNITIILSFLIQFPLINKIILHINVQRSSFRKQTPAQALTTAPFPNPPTKHQISPTRHLIPLTTNLQPQPKKEINAKIGQIHSHITIEQNASIKNNKHHEQTKRKIIISS